MSEAREEKIRVTKKKSDDSTGISAHVWIYCAPQSCTPAEPPPLRQPSVSLRMRSRFEKYNPFNDECSYTKVSHVRGPPHSSVDEFEDKCSPRRSAHRMQMTIRALASSMPLLIS